MEKIGKYDIKHKLGDGATSSVFLAHDPFARRDVAIKIIFPEALQDKQRGRLYRNLLLNEASLAGKLEHPHIVQIYDAVINEQESYIVMEYVAGGTLEAYADPNALLPVERVVEIIFKCTRALEFANQSGVTHRDIKPANILLTIDGDIKISDFGAALFTANERTQVSGVGSPAYMSPQQVREMPLNHQTDIYSLGVVMYQLLTGHLPFQGSNNYTLVYQITNTLPPPPSTYRPDIPAGLDAVVARAMQKDLDARYASWTEFSHDLALAFRNRQIRQRTRVPEQSEKLAMLRKLPFFAEFSDVEMWEVARMCEFEQVSAGTRIVKDGEQGDNFWLLVEGEVQVAKRGRTLAILTSGECFGEMAVMALNNRTRCADVSTVTEVKLANFSGDALRRASEVCRMRFYQVFMQIMVSRIVLSNSRFIGLWEQL
ncbi:MAG: protein kinase [Rhodocyclaceae bacterium]|nr:protein kinase [Rhodocyclaceae bacterium]MBX3667615.1 protein kinase [Rhodocyclaceae bacterium]